MYVCMYVCMYVSLVLLFSKNVLGNTAKLGATEKTTLSNPQLINRLAGNQNFSYFAVGFSVISLTINIPMLEIRLESIQPTQFRQKWYHWALQSDSPKKQCRKCHAKPKFHKLRRWVLFHFAHEKLTKATNTKSTEMVNYFFADRQCRRLSHPKTTRITSRNTWEFKHNKLSTSD